MNTPIFEFAKTNACQLLEQHFPSFKCSVSFTSVAFLYEQSESDCGGDDVEEVPCGFILREFDKDHCVLFFRESDDVVFHGFFDTCSDAHDYGCDRLIMELYLSDFDDLADNFVPADFTAPQQDSISVPASNPVEGQPDFICLYDGNPCEKECDEWNCRGCWCGYTHFPENTNLSTKTVDKL